jgi:hypothetical protein
MLTLAVMAAPVIAFAADATSTADTPADACANVKWSEAFLKTFPKAPAACRDVTLKDGVKYAMFNGKVSRVGPHFVEVDIFDDADLPISTVAFQVGDGGRVTLNDKVQSVRDLIVGDQLTFWIREGQFGSSPTVADEPISIIKPEAMPAS